MLFRSMAVEQRGPAVGNDSDHKEGKGGMTKTPISVPVGDGGNPSPSGEARFRVTCSRATLSTGSAHEERPEGASGVDSEVPEAGADWGGRDSCARPD